MPYEKEARKKAMILPQLGNLPMTITVLTRIMAGGCAAGCDDCEWANDWMLVLSSG